MTTRSQPIAGTSRRRTSATRREDLLDQLQAVLLQEGFRALTMDDIAARLRCSKSTLYALAPSKEQLVIKVTKHFFRQAAAEIEGRVSAEPDPSLRVSTYLAGVGAAMHRHSPAFYRDMVEFPPTAETYRQNSRVAARRVRELIDDGAAAGGFRKVHGVFVAQLVALAIDGIQSGELLETSGLTSGDAYTEVGDLLLHGLAVKDEMSAQD